MKITKGSSILLGICSVSLLIGCAASGPQPIGPNKYTLTSSAYWAWSGTGQQATALSEANEFCAKKGLVANVLSMSATDAVAYQSVASGTVTFECVRPSSEEDPVELAGGVYMLAGSSSGYQGIKARYQLMKQASQFCSKKGLKVLPIEATREQGKNYTSLTGEARTAESAESSTQSSSADLLFRCVKD